MSFTEHRLKLILEKLKQSPRVYVNALVDELQVSAESIRRDLKELETRGYVRRVYGGAVVDQHESDQPFMERLRVGAREKARIGEVAAGMVKDGMKIFVDAGTTTLSCLRHLDARKDVTIVTNSIAVAAHFFNKPDASVRVLGGQMRADYQATYGHETAEALKAHFFDLAILSVGAVHLERGFMDHGEDEALLRRIVRAQAGRTAMLVDSSKFGRTGSIHTLGLDEVDAVVTSGILSKEFSSRFDMLNVEVIHA